MIIDCHTHLLPRQAQQDRSEYLRADPGFGSLYSSPKARIASSDDIIHYLDKSGVDRAIVFGFPWESYDTAKRNNDEVWEFHQRYPDRIIPFATFSLLGRDLAYKEADRTLSGGFAGLGELSMYGLGWNLADFVALNPCFAIATARQVPVMIHVNEPVGHKYPGKISIDIRALFKTIKNHQDMDFILAHFGGGLFIYSLMPEIGQTMKRVYVDTAAAPFLYDSRIVSAAVNALGKENVLFGTDYPLLGISRYEKLLDEAEVHGALRSNILGENVLRILERRLS